MWRCWHVQIGTFDADLAAGFARCDASARPPQAASPNDKGSQFKGVDPYQPIAEPIEYGRS